MICPFIFTVHKIIFDQFIMKLKNVIFAVLMHFDRNLNLEKLASVIGQIHFIYDSLT